jgi:hypothetical protein
MARSTAGVRSSAGRGEQGPAERRGGASSGAGPYVLVCAALQPDTNPDKMRRRE